MLLKTVKWLDPDAATLFPWPAVKRAIDEALAHPQRPIEVLLGHYDNGEKRRKVTVWSSPGGTGFGFSVELPAFQVQTLVFGLLWVTRNLDLPVMIGEPSVTKTLWELLVAIHEGR